MNKPTSPGITFCPQCGCNVGLIARAMELSMPQMPKLEPRPESPAPKPKPKVKLPPAEIVRRVDQGRAQGRQLKEIMAEMGLSETAIYPARKRVELERLQALASKTAAKPKTAPALVVPKPKRQQLPAGSITPEQKAEMKRRKAAGESVAHIAQSMGFKIGTVGPIIYKKEAAA